MKRKRRNKPFAKKHRVREEKKRKQRIALAIAFLFVLASVSGFAVNSMLNQHSLNQANDSQPKATIVDHLSLTYPNQTFIETATNTLEQAGYTVDYYPSENVTVELYRNLPAHDYKIIVLRVHSTATNTDKSEGAVSLFTSERHSNAKYVYEQLTGQLVGVAFSTEEREKGIVYFGINPSFVTRSMRDKFQDTIIIMMGCEGLRNTSMATAFVNKGAIVYVSWNGSVLASYTDQATTRLMQHFLAEKRRLKESVQETFKDVGADPAYNSLLIYYPLEAGSYDMKSVLNNLAISVIGINLKCSLKRERPPTFTF